MIMKSIPLIGMKNKSDAARIGAEVKGFLDADRKVAVTVSSDSKSVVLKTTKGSYTLHKSLVTNRYQGSCNGHRVHLCLKKVSGKLVYWA